MNRIIVVLIVTLSIISIFGIEVFSQTYKSEIKVSSNIPFFVNGTLTRPGSYTFQTQLINITFQQNFDVYPASRTHLVAVKVNNTYYHSNVVVISSNNKTSGCYLVSPLYEKQYYVNISSQYPFPISSGWFNVSQSVGLPRNYFYQLNDTRYIPYDYCINGEKFQSIFVTSPLTAVVVYKEQFYVNTSSQYRGYINGTVKEICSGWYPSGTNITLARYLYQNEFTRFFTYGNLISTKVLNAPLFINDTQIEQFYITVKTPILAYISGKLENMISGWYNKSEEICVPNYVTLSNNTRLITMGNYSGIHYLGGGVFISDVQLEQDLLTFPIPLLLNYSGNITTQRYIWIFNGSSVKVMSQIVYLSNVTRDVVPKQILTFNNFSKLVFYTQNYLSLDVPVYGKINGLNSSIYSSWLNATDNVTVFRIYYINGENRLVISSDRYNFTMVSPVSINDYYIQEYLVQILGIYGSDTVYNFTAWEPNSSIISIPLLYLYKGETFELNTSTINNYNNITIHSPKKIVVEYLPEVSNATQVTGKRINTSSEDLILTIVFIGTVISIISALIASVLLAKKRIE
ncbi:hypothetical protein HS7_15130 [Sulfolobales archaeon HS-7]|nr:hypothetical protein HS7_15130 [Sulfolobales archaeon HS-7]